MVQAAEKEIDVKAILAENEALKKKLAGAGGPQVAVVAPSFEMDGPVDPIKFARGKKCSSGHESWDETKVVFVMDHQAFALRCKAKGCDGMFHFIRPGSMKVMPAPRGWASDVGIEDYVEEEE